MHKQFAKEVIEKHGHVDFLVNNALPLMKDIDECSYEEFQYAMSVGVDSCWVNFFDPDKMAEAFQLPKNEEILTCLALGYPAEGAGPLANHNSRKPIEETVTYL